MDIGFLADVDLRGPNVRALAPPGGTKKTRGYPSGNVFVHPT